MGASLTALAAVVRADVAQASITPTPVELSDELPDVIPVKMTKVEHAQPAEEDLDVDVVLPKRGRIDFGAFEGY